LGGPYGGDGGNGGDVIAIGDHNLNTLFELRNHKTLRAQNGENGRTAQETGKGGECTYVKLPLGTSIYNAKTNELIADILEPGQTFVICEGGKGGRGNTFFKSSFNRAPTLHENGDKGQEMDVVLKLRYIADIGMVGLPNAGKSTFIGQVSNAKPRVANYEFTTLTPVLGVVNLHDKKIVFSDLPGLIEGASEGRGLGHEFLKHIERCHILIHLVSLNSVDNVDVVKAYQTINDELEKYDSSLMNKPIIIVANKIDVDTNQTNLKTLSKFLKHDVIAISAKNNIGVKELLENIYKEYIKIEQINQIKLRDKVQKVKVIELKKQKDYSLDLTIKQINDNT
jgi:GTP-binding protein